MKSLSVGDSIWVIPGYYENHLLAIKCKITEVDDEFAKTNPLGTIFYFIDEPVGHGLTIEDFFFTKEDAELELVGRFNSAVIHNEKETKDEYRMILKNCVYLEDFRRSAIAFVVGTHDDISREEGIRRAFKWFDELPKKQRGTDWFNLRDVRGF